MLPGFGVSSIEVKLEANNFSLFLEGPLAKVSHGLLLLMRRGMMQAAMAHVKSNGGPNSNIILY